MTQTSVRPVHDAALFGATASIEHYEVARFVHVAPARPGAAVVLTRLEADPSRLDDALAEYRDGSAGPLTGADGFCTAVLLVDRPAGRAVVETAASAGAATVRGIEQYRLDLQSVELE